MIFNIVKWIIFSVVLIALVHHLYDYFQGTLTIPKTRDLVNRPAERYEEMLATIKPNNNTDFSINKQPNEKDTNNMRDELADFLKDLKKSKVNQEQEKCSTYSR